MNDTYGHLIGDEALKVVARDLLANARSTDLVGRWGGEEFMVVLVNADEAVLQAAAERFRMTIEASIVHGAKGDFMVTVSAGAAVARKGEPIAQLVDRADRALFAAKDAGRNRVVMATDQAPPS